jgi:hypothetical protein
MCSLLDQTSNLGARHILWEGDAKYERAADLFLIVSGPLAVLSWWSVKLYDPIMSTGFSLLSIWGLWDLFRFQGVHYTITNEFITAIQSIVSIRKTKQIRIDSLTDILITYHGKHIHFSTRDHNDMVLALRKEEVTKVKQIMDSFRGELWHPIAADKKK